jgi:acyl-CoA thioesterase-1
MRYLSVILCLCTLIMAVSPFGDNHAFGADTPSDKTIMAFGDSLVAGHGLPLNEAFPERLEARLRGKGYAVKVVNAGVSGNTTADGVARLEWNLKMAKPDYVILVMGGNDMLRAIDPAVTAANLQKMMEILKAHHLPVLLCGMKAFANLGPAYMTAYDTMYKKLADSYGAVYYPFFLQGVALKPEFNQEDGVHPNAIGVNLIVGLMTPTVEKLLKGAAAPPAKP